MFFFVKVVGLVGGGYIINGAYAFWFLDIYQTILNEFVPWLIQSISCIVLLFVCVCVRLCYWLHSLERTKPPGMLIAAA